jgi:hypothetical protein
MQVLAILNCTGGVKSGSLANMTQSIPSTSLIDHSQYGLATPSSLTRFREDREPTNGNHLASSKRQEGSYKGKC